MFGLFKKKKVNDPDFLKRIEKDGVDYVAKRMSEILIENGLPNKEIAYEFILQELDGARQGNNYAQDFAKNCGIPKGAYFGSLKNDTPELDIAQNIIQNISSRLMPMMDLAVELRIKIVNNVMQEFEFGKYYQENSDEEIEEYDIFEEDLEEYYSYYEECHDEDFDEEETNENIEAKVLITDPFNPTLDVETHQGIYTYRNKIASLAFEDLCIEFSNVMSAKHNSMMSVGLSDYQANQRIVRDLTDKALIICLSKFGNEKVLAYGNNDLTLINQLINQCDEQVASIPVPPLEHGMQLFNLLERHF